MTKFRTEEKHVGGEKLFEKIEILLKTRIVRIFLSLFFWKIQRILSLFKISLSKLRLHYNFYFI